MKKMLYQVYQVKTSSKHFPLEREFGQEPATAASWRKGLQLTILMILMGIPMKQPTRSMGGLRDRNIKTEQVQKLIDIGRDQCAETTLQAAL